MMSRWMGALTIGLALVATAHADNGNASPLTDGQILKIAETANAGEVSAGKLAESRATNADVKSFAAMMVTHHSAAKTSDENVAKQTKIKTASSGLADKLKADGDASEKMLKAQKGVEFDRAYVNAQARAHGDVLELVDKTLIPAAKDPAVKKLLEDMRGVVQQHLDAVTKLKTQLGG